MQQRAIRCALYYKYAQTTAHRSTKALSDGWCIVSMEQSHQAAALKQGQSSQEGSRPPDSAPLIPIFTFSPAAGADAFGGACSAATARVCRQPRLMGSLQTACFLVEPRSKQKLSPRSGCAEGKAATGPANQHSTSVIESKCLAFQQFLKQSRGRTACHRTAQGALHVDQHRHGVKYMKPTFLKRLFALPTDTLA